MNGGQNCSAKAVESEPCFCPFTWNGLTPAKRGFGKCQVVEKTAGSRTAPAHAHFVWFQRLGPMLVVGDAILAGFGEPDR